jgi:hypothetical protein
METTTSFSYITAIGDHEVVFYNMEEQQWFDDRDLATVFPCPYLARSYKDVTKEARAVWPKVGRISLVTITTKTAFLE